jgi:hypothetical protein
VSSADRPPLRDLIIRLAESAEKPQVRSLDDRIFPDGDPNLQRAPAGELETGVEAGDVYVTELAGRLVGYLHIDRTDPRLVNLSGAGIVPELQNRGIGTAMTALVRTILADYADLLPVCAVTSPQNPQMLHLLFSMRFAGRWMLADHWGPGRHRIGFQLLRATSRLPEADRVRQVGPDDLGQLARLTGAGWAIRRQRSQSERVFELSPATVDDFLPCPRPSASLGTDPA